MAVNMRYKSYEDLLKGNVYSNAAIFYYYFF